MTHTSSIGRPPLLILRALFLLCLCGVMPAHAMPRGSSLTPPSQGHGTIRNAPAPRPALPRRDELHNGFDASTLLLWTAGAPTRYRSETGVPATHYRGLAGDGARRARDAFLALDAARPVESLPAHWGATHLSV